MERADLDAPITLMEDPQCLLCRRFSRLQEEACAYEAAHNRSAARVGQERITLSIASPFRDADDDLMPDEWEAAVGLDPTDPGDALEDPDADSLINLQEFIRSGDPLVPDRADSISGDHPDPPLLPLGKGR